MLTYIDLYAIAVISTILFVWSYRHIFRPHYEKKRLREALLKDPNTQKFATTLDLLKTLEKNTQGFHLSQKERSRLHLISAEFIYGEIIPLSFLAILERLNIQPEDIFYDLGCGAGKAVFVTALCFDIKKSYGIEYLPKLYDLAENNKKQLLEIIEEKKNVFLPHTDNLAEKVIFIQGDITEVPFNDASILFINATCYSPKTWAAIMAKLEKLPIGARVIMTTKKINHSAFEVLFQERYLMSWGMNSVNVYLKIQ